MCVCAAFKDQKGEGLKPPRASPPLKAYGGGREKRVCATDDDEY